MSEYIDLFSCCYRFFSFFLFFCVVFSIVYRLSVN